MALKRLHVHPEKLPVVAIGIVESRGVDEAILRLWLACRRPQPLVSQFIYLRVVSQERASSRHTGRVGIVNGPIKSNARFGRVPSTSPVISGKVDKIRQEFSPLLDMEQESLW